MDNDRLRELSLDFWNKTFQNSEYDYKKLADKDWSVFIKNLKEEKVENVLDYGFGGGHWSIILSRAGFNVTAYEISEVAISNLINWTQEEGLTIKIVNDLIGNCDKFDCIICNSVIDHLVIEDAIKTLSFFKTNIKKNGIAYLSFDNEEDEDKHNYRDVKDGLRYYTSGIQKGMIWKYYCNDDIKELCKDFVIESFITTKSGRRQIWLRN